ncbi:thiolase family protein (plasmid) [Rhodococcus pyridinivorans]|uniref:thiolase family protein n=1 Tax=Rhodococcus TaxID=1827 RepID=UPI0007D8D808|nr:MULTISPECIES: thiolase family protein [Rhodococcus]MCT7293646.1 thiolase family protein [Rhodococcus sp. PAE-6]QXU56430.1 thiolase family protein [Rhodococcus sp. LW-XY12]UQB75799.1 thiolase family protein [Rhodococcus ruber]UVT27487.1 thiolase family protein [Rhodococcus pyridinivorans]WML66463.1 thiolase family protein [Rhodococcus sp. AH-ZY2]
MNRLEEVVIVDAVRSPMAKGKPGGELSSLHPTELLGQVLCELIRRSDLDPALVDDVLTGCVTQAGEQGGTVGRVAWLAAGLPLHVPSATIERKCGSGQQAVVFAAQAIASGQADIVIASGVESMSRVPMGAAKLGQDGYGPAMRARFPHLTSQGVAADRVAAAFGLGREDLDAYSAESHRRAQSTVDGGGFDNEIVPVTVADGARVNTDSTIRPTTSVEGLAKLAPAFAGGEVATTFPDLQGVTTAGSSSQVTDGAAAVLLMSASRANSLGLAPRARLASSTACGDDPEMMLTAPIPATRKVLARANLTLDDIDIFEVNEAFASVPMAWMTALGVDHGRVNPRGGAISLGHPLGASGVRLLTTLINALDQSGARYGLQTMCEAGGMANAYIVESLTH